MSESQIQFPDKFQPLFRPKRYKVYYGGRGGAKSWNFARALLLIGRQKVLRVLCARELQNSIQESVYKLLADQIEALGLGKFYLVLKAQIVGENGTTFSFEGIRNNAKKIRSYEGIDVCWVEEADAVSAESWDILIPTIRKVGSEIWISFNPQREKDETYKRFVLRKSSDTIAIKVGYQDNPWFPETLRLEMEKCKALDYDKYLHIWEGFPKVVLDGGIYAEEIRAAKIEGRVTFVPWERETPVETFWDLGKRDHTSIWFIQRVAMQWRVLRFYESTGKDLSHYLKVCADLPYTYGTFHLPHDGGHQRLGMPKSIAGTMREAGRQVRVWPRISVAEGIAATRGVFSNCWFDEAGCEIGLDHLGEYKYSIDPETNGYSEKPLHDEHSDAADAFRTFGMASGLKPRLGLLGKTLEKIQDKLNLELQSPHSWMGR